MAKKGKRAKAGTSKASAATRRALFVEAYIANGGNATEAAKAAGYAPDSAHVTGSRLLSDAKVGAAIDARRARLQERFELNTERVLQEVGRIALYDPRKLFNEDGTLKRVLDLDDDTAAAIASVEVDEIGTQGVVIGYTKKIKAWDKNAAIEKVMKHLGMFEKDKDPPAPPANVNVSVTLKPDEAYLRMIGVGGKR